jgi:hypothetical protein
MTRRPSATLRRWLVANIWRLSLARVFLNALQMRQREWSSPFLQIGYHWWGRNRGSRPPRARGSSVSSRQGLHTVRKRMYSDTLKERSRAAISSTSPLVRLAQSLLPED